MFPDPKWKAKWMNMFDIQSPVISSSYFLFRHPTDEVFSQQLICLLRQLKLVLKCLTILVLFDDDLLNKGNKNLVARHTTRYTKKYTLPGTTFLAILPLAFSSSQAFRVFFKMFFGIVVAGGPPQLRASFHHLFPRTNGKKVTTMMG